MPQASLEFPQGKKPKTVDIIAAQKIIADISSGVYRSPASALKELISNAYDADARHVRITTDAPNFSTLTITDDGEGMTAEKFLDVITHIGGSTKRISRDTTPRLGRKVIGRIGIGLLAVAQLSNRFYVSSSVQGSTKRFLAEIDLEPFHRDDAALASMGKLKKDGTVTIGAVKLVTDLEERAASHFTTITVPDAKRGLISEITSAVRRAVGAKEPLSIDKNRVKSFAQIIERTRQSTRADLVLDGYYYMLWELGLLCPVNYLDAGPFGSGGRNIEGIDALTLPKVTDFKVIVDGIELFRPQAFPSPAAHGYSSPDPKVYPLSFDQDIAGRRLKFTGYIYSQQPRIDPEEFKGVHIRIRDVGIGRYDKTWLGYPFDEGIKFGQVSGEVFVEEGLEPALNIDRDSFRETDVHFQAMRAFLWNMLRKEVFPDFKNRAAHRRKEKKSSERSVHSARLADVLGDLPAPTSSASVVDEVRTPTLGTWVTSRDDGLLLDKKKWREFATSCGLGKDEQERFLRVVAVLVSSELLSSAEPADVDKVLRALAIAIQ